MMRNLRRDLLAISVKRSPFIEIWIRRIVDAYACVQSYRRTFNYKYYGIWKSNFEFVCSGNFGSTMNTFHLCHHGWYTISMLIEHWCLANSHGQHSFCTVAILWNEKSTSTQMLRSMFNFHLTFSIQCREEYIISVYMQQFQCTIICLYGQIELRFNRNCNASKHQNTKCTEIILLMKMH